MEAYERKIEETKSWLTDETDRVRKFSADYITSLEKRAKSEPRRAEEQIELRKHVYGRREKETDGDGGVSEGREIADGDNGNEM